MKLQVEQAFDYIGKSIPFTYTVPATLLGDVTAFPWSRHDITINGEFWHNGQNILVKGIVLTDGAYECTRCTASTRHQGEVAFEETFSREGEVLDEEVRYFSGETIDLTELIRETLIINEPFQVLCQEDCKGLCVRCGVNLNHSQCECDSFVVDPRWAKLRALLTEDD